MTRFRALTLTAVLAGLLAGGVALAQGPGPGHRGHGGPGGFGGFGGPGGLPLHALNLTETQQDQIRQVMQRSREQNRNVGEQLRTAVEAERTAAETIPVDEGLIRSTTQALVEAQTEMAIQRARLQSEIFALLTSDQRRASRRSTRERATKRFRPLARPGWARHPGRAARCR